MNRISHVDKPAVAKLLAAYLTKKDAEAASVDGNDVCYRHPSPAQLRSSQIIDGIEMEIRSYQNPLFTPKGYAID